MKPFAFCLGLVICSGCFTPRWHDGTPPLNHRIRRVVVCEETPDSLIVGGTVGRVVALTDYGLKAYEAADDKGNRLDLRSFRIFWAKALCFQIELSAPDPTATSVNLDLAFRSRSGIERITSTFPIHRTEHGDYFSSLKGWQQRE